jgi:AcrR family transcriptional regulator
MSPRLTRIEQSQRNRTLVLAAARRAFLARGYHAASLDQIADEAGFSKGVVYSQFESKADLLLALLEQRIDERTEEHARFVEGLVTRDGLSINQGLRALAEHVTRRDRADAEWGLLVIEFRVHAARDASLNRRYTTLHERTVRGVARIVAAIYERTGDAMPMPADDLARLLLATSVGARLEQAANSDARPMTLVAELAARVPGSREKASAAGTSKRGRVA